MNQVRNNDSDSRLDDMLEVIFKFAAGDLSARGRLSGDDSALDGVMAGINILGEELQAKVLETEQAQQALADSEALLRAIFDSVQDGIILAEAESRQFRMVNPAICQMLGYSDEELLKIGVEGIHPEDVLPYVYDQFERFFLGEINLSPNLPMLRKDGELIYADVTAGIMTVGGVSCLVGVFRDITERLKQERALRESEERAKSILDNVVEVFFITDAELTPEYISPRSMDIFGYSAEEMIVDPGLGIQTIHPEDRERVMKQMTEARLTGSRAVNEYRVVRKDGSVRWVRTVSNPVVDADGKLQKVYGTLTDITEFESLRSSLKEKEVLLKEIHHRVKNNLQIVVSLLRLESRAFDEERVLDVLEDLETRIRAMALVHEHLYHSSDLSKIGFKDYLRGLTAELFRTYHAEGGRINLEVDAEAVALDIERAIPCGLIINELITNAIKYAYPDNREGTVQVAFRNLSGNMVEITVADDGIGIPGTVDIRTTRTLGLQLVTTLVENQLKGSLDLERHNGTRFTIRFSI